MPDTPLSDRETAIVLLLMAEAREMSNPELEKQYGVKIDRAERERLHRLNLIEVGKNGSRAYTHALTDKGWVRAGAIFREGIPKSRAPRAFEAVARAMAARLRRYLERTGTPLAEIFGREEDLTPAGTSAAGQTAPRPAPSQAAAACEAPATPVGDAADAADVETRIRNAYARLAGEPNAWVSLTRLRPLLGDLPREEVDAALRRLIRQPDVHIIPESNQKALTDADRRAAVIIGDQAKHLILIGA